MSSQAAALQASRERGLAYLAAAQRPDGGFDSFSSPSARRFETALTYQTTFVPSLMLGALSALPAPLGQNVRQRLAAFVRAQKSPLWSYNYWAKASPERRRQPYPDDLDDTCCALIGLVLHDASALEPAALAAVVKLLLATETKPGGPYRTWLVAPGAPAVWRDVDLAVNANIAYLLSLISEPLPNLTALMETAMHTGRLASPYYASRQPLVYYLARAYQGHLTVELLAIAQQLRRQAAAQTALQQALLLTSLVRLGATVGTGVLAQRLLTAQRADGSWPPAAFCLDPTQSGQTYYHGADSLTTAFALEALHLYQQNRHQLPGRTSAQSRRRDAGFVTRVVAAVQHDCRQFQPELRTTTEAFVRKVVHASSGPGIAALPLQFDQSLVQPLGPAFRPFLTRLGQANLYGWTAYTIFDDFLDDEGQPALLPVATAALRYSLSAFAQALPDDRQFQRLVREAFDMIDAANAWEVSHCRFARLKDQIVIKPLPDYGDPARLANRSLGHGLTPLAVLRAHGVGQQSRLFRGVRQAMIHYLAARQLNDDAHDWQIDFQNGHITYVVARLLADEQVAPGRHKVNVLLKRLQRRFWHHTLPDLCRVMQAQTALSRSSLHGLHDLQPSNVITDLLDGIDASISETLAAQAQAAAFLKHYKTTPATAV